MSTAVFDDARIGLEIAMDVETAEVVETLRRDIRRVEKTLTGRVGGVESSLAARIDSVEESLTARIDSVESSLTVRIEHVESSLTNKIEHVESSLSAKMDEQKRHTDVHFESVHGDIRMLAEHLASLTVKVDSLLHRSR